MPRTDASYFNFILKSRSLRFDDKIVVLDEDEYDDFQYESFSSDDVTYNSSTGVVKFSKGGAYEICYTDVISVAGNNRDYDQDVSPKFYINDELKYVAAVHRRSNYDPTLNTYRAILEIPDNGALKIMVDLSGSAESFLHPGSIVSAQRITGHYGRVHISGTTMSFKNINPFTGSFTKTSGPQATYGAGSKLLNQAGFDDTHGRLISSGTSLPEGETGIYAVSFNGIWGTGTLGGVSITASQNGTDFYSKAGYVVSLHDPGPVQNMQLIRKMRKDDYVSLYVQNFNTSDEIGEAACSLDEGTTFAINEIRSHAYHCSSVSGYSSQYNGISKTISGGERKNPWKLSDTDVWDDTADADLSASLTTHAESPYIIYDQGSGKFTVKRNGVYFLSSINNIRCHSVFGATYTRELRVNGKTTMSSSEGLINARAEQRDYGEAGDIITLLSLSAGDEVEVYGECPGAGWSFGQGTSLTMYKVGDDWKYKDDDYTVGQHHEPVDLIQEDFVLNTYSTGGNNIQHKRDVFHTPFITSTPGPLSLRGKVEVDRLSKTLNEEDAERYLFTKK